MTGEHVGEPGLDADPHQGEPARRLPLRGGVELRLPEQHPRLLVRLLRVFRREAHRHVEVGGTRLETPVEDRHHEARVHRVEDVRGTVLQHEGGHGLRR
jgi:hypothetical protein